MWNREIEKRYLEVIQEFKSETVKAVLIEKFTEEDEIGGHRFGLLFTNNKIVIFEAEGDCCSETWFADFIGLDYLRGKTLESIEDLELDIDTKKLSELGFQLDARYRQEVERFYSLRINKRTEIIYRNSSNGYYGGSIGAVNVVDGDSFTDEEAKRWETIISNNYTFLGDND